VLNFKGFCKTSTFLVSILLLFFIQTKAQHSYLPKKQVSADFKKLLQRPLVPLKPSFKQVTTDSVLIEEGYIYSEKNEKVPILIYKPLSTAASFPVMICLHGTGGRKDEANMRDLLYRFAQKGIMGVAVDARYHGNRISGGVNGKDEYERAIIRAWKNKDPKKQEHPFFYDTVYDLWRLTDYLVTRKDVQKKRIGMMGISMGGIETWMAASVDKRIKVAVPVIAAQSFKWSLENTWHGRVNTIKRAHEIAAKDAGDSTINEENIKAFWNKLIPGITGKFDCPSMIRLFAPRSLLLLSTENDLNCPLPGAKIAFRSAEMEYESMNASEKLKIDVAPNEGHRFIPKHQEMMIDFVLKWL
jgi:cephalosporin-C deacetylase-like acetyl esterase